MTWLLHDSKGLALVKCISLCLYERTHPARISCAWTQGIWILECNGLGVYFFKYSDEHQIKQDFVCIWYSADNKKQGNWMYWQMGMAKRGDTSWCPYCCLVHRDTGSSSPHLLVAVWMKRAAESSWGSGAAHQISRTQSGSRTSKTGLEDFGLVIPNFNRESDKGS